MSKALVPPILTGEKSMRYSGMFGDWVKISNAITPEKNPTGHKILNRKPKASNSTVGPVKLNPAENATTGLADKATARPVDKATWLSNEDRLAQLYVDHKNADLGDYIGKDLGDYILVELKPGYNLDGSDDEFSDVASLDHLFEGMII
ncbi:hypothetical protein Tco_0554644, partial [Tanacetum coccineum]